MTESTKKPLLVKEVVLYEIKVQIGIYRQIMASTL